MNDDQRKLAEKLRSWGYKAQERFKNAERTAIILEQMLKANIDVAIDGTYELHTFTPLRYQLFRMLIVDLYASVLDNNSRTASVKAILEELQKNDKKAVSALRAYYSDASGLNMTVEGSGLDAHELEYEKEEIRNRHSQNNANDIDKLWDSVCNRKDVLDGHGAKRLKWARDKVIAHYETTENNLVALDDDPPCGEGKLTWKEPIKFMDEIRSYVNNVFLLLTYTSFDSRSKNIHRFYSSAFWDRFKNGKSDLKPDEFK